jgi:K+-transporting ATPase ATPase A chain
MWLLPALVLVASVALSVPAGLYLARVMDAPRLPVVLRRFEALVDTGPQSWRQYAAAMLLFNALLFVVGFAALALQPALPLNPDGKAMLAPTTVFHTTVSFFANNSLQHYSGEQHLSYFSQLLPILWNMFAGGATSLAALAALTRALRGDPHLGNFYVDLWRGAAYVLVPFSLAVGLPLLAAGVPMTFGSAEPAAALESGQQQIARGPVAALVPVKNLASVGGGFFGANSAHPFENPAAWADVVQCVSVLLLPCAVIVLFGRMLGRPREAAVLYAVVLLLLVALTGWAVYWDGGRPNLGLSGLPLEDGPWGNLEGKELRFGPSAGPTYAAVTTAVACGSVNCMHDSLNPLAGLPLLTGMWLNCVFGGKGVGLVNLLVFLMVAVFLTGLMVGRTPEYLGKKIEAREMKLAMLAFFIHPLMILGPAALFVVTDWGRQSASNPGAHGFSQVLYEFSSASAGNGSGFEGLGDTWGFNDPDKNPNPPAPYSPHWDIATGLVMIISRFVPIVAALALAAGLAAKPTTPFTVGTLRTDTATFGVVLLGTILILGALVYLPAAVLGPVAEHFGPLPFGG